ncbi:MAG: hypothetical protein LBS55_02800, partial [Prevotellaceae bacterium]|nr:hypothetical protein [Prevotellaceae bacterium]
MSCRDGACTVSTDPPPDVPSRRARRDDVRKFKHTDTVNHIPEKSRSARRDEISVETSNHNDERKSRRDDMSVEKNVPPPFINP